VELKSRLLERTAIELNVRKWFKITNRLLRRARLGRIFCAQILWLELGTTPTGVSARFVLWRRRLRLSCWLTPGEVDGDGEENEAESSEDLDDASKGGQGFLVDE